MGVTSIAGPRERAAYLHRRHLLMRTETTPVPEAIAP